VWPGTLTAETVSSPGCQRDTAAVTDRRELKPEVVRGVQPQLSTGRSDQSAGATEVIGVQVGIEDVGDRPAVPGATEMYCSSAIEGSITTQVVAGADHVGETALAPSSKLHHRGAAELSLDRRRTSRPRRPFALEDVTGDVVAREDLGALSARAPMAQMTTTFHRGDFFESFLERVERDVVHTGNLPVGHLIDLAHVEACTGIRRRRGVGGARRWRYWKSKSARPRESLRVDSLELAPSRNEGLVMTEARNVNVAEVLELLDGGAFLLDVREDNEWSRAGPRTPHTFLSMTCPTTWRKCRVIA